MTTERIVGPLQKVMQSIADLAAPRDPQPPPPTGVHTPPPHSAATDTTHAAPDAAKTAPPDTYPMLPAAQTGLAPPPSGDDALRSLAFGLPPPAVALNTGGAATVPLATALQSVGDRYLNAPVESRRKDEAGDDRPVITTVTEVQASGEVRETQFIKGVPKAAVTVAVDDRPRVAIPREKPDEPTKPEGRKSEAETARLELPAATSSPALDHPAHARHDPPWVDALATALSAPMATHALAGRILPSAILNAAMLPGWPPPRLLEGKAIAGTSDHELAALRREDHIAILMAAFGTELGDVFGSSTDRRAHWRWLRRISQLLAGLMVLISTLGTELAEMQGDDEEVAEGRSNAGPRQGNKRRIYLE